MSNRISLFMTPKDKPRAKHQCGVDVVVSKMHELLPAAGVDILTDVNAPVDIVATHINAHNATRTPNVLHCHGLYPTGDIVDPPGWMWQVNKTVIDCAVRAERVSVPSPWVQQLFARDMGFLPTVIPHGIDLSHWPERRHPQQVTPDRLCILWNKNRISPVCDVAPVNDLAEQMPTGMLLLSTLGSKRQNTRILGTMTRKKMVPIIYETDVYFSSTRETFGIGTLEALAAGCPVLGWDWGHTPYLIDHGVDGYIVPPGDIKETIAGLMYIQENYERMSLAAREKAAQYPWANAMEQYAQMYREVIALQESPAHDHVTVVIPCYNYGNYVEQAISSVQKQTYTNFDCIIIDDGSTDDSAAVISKAISGDPRFQLITKENGGVASSRNLGAYRASGEYLAFLDADDILKPTCLHDLILPLKQDRSVAISYGGLNIINPEGTKTRGVGDWPEEYSVEKQFSLQNRIPSCCLMRREIFMRTGGVRQRLSPTEDAELWTRFPLLGYTAIRATTKATYDYRLHNKSASMAVRGKGEPVWNTWLGPLHGGKMPFASISAPADNPSHPVINYDTPEVSIITPVGPGHEKYLVDAIDSVLGQNYDRWEMIVVDDTGGDVSSWGEIPYKERYPWVKWVKNEKRGNVSAARNLGVAASSGRYLVFLDADDFFYRDFLAKTTGILENCTDDTRLVYTDWVSLPKAEKHRAENWNLDRIRDHALFAVTFLHPRSSFDAVGGFDESLELWEDWDYVIRLALSGYVGIHCIGPLFAYRYNTGQRREESLANKDALLRRIRGKYATQTPAPRRG